MATIMDDKLTPDKLQAWIDKAKPGQRIEYYRGDLAFDRQSVTQINGRNYTVINEPMDSLGKIAWNGYRQGKLILYQTREDYASFHYFAMKRHYNPRSKAR